MVLDLKYYSEVILSNVKNLNNKINKDFHFSEKHEIIKLIESKFKIKKIFYSNAFSSFILIFNCTEEQDVYYFLSKLQKIYKGIQFYLEIDPINFENKFECSLKIEYKINEIKSN